MTTKMTLREYRAEQAARGVSADDRLKGLIGGNERLNTHHWTDEQLEAIPEDLVQFAYETIESLRMEFGAFTTFKAYRRACMAGRARIAGRK